MKTYLNKGDANRVLGILNKWSRSNRRFTMPQLSIIENFINTTLSKEDRESVRMRKIEKDTLFLCSQDNSLDSQIVRREIEIDFVPAKLAEVIKGQ